MSVITGTPNLSWWRGPTIIFLYKHWHWEFAIFRSELSNTGDGKAESEWVPDNYQRRCLLVIIKVTISRRRCPGSSHDAAVLGITHCFLSSPGAPRRPRCVWCVWCVVWCVVYWSIEVVTADNTFLLLSHHTSQQSPIWLQLSLF